MMQISEAASCHVYRYTKLLDVVRHYLAVMEADCDCWRFRHKFTLSSWQIVDWL